MVLRRLMPVVALALTAAACGIPTEDEAPGTTSTTSPIIGGKAAGVCEWPTTVLVAGGCSGTLVHPRVVMTAKHCLSRTPASIQFGESRQNITRTVKVAQCYKNPTSDFGFCTLAEDVTGFPLIPVMAPCEMTELKMGAPVVESGFGDQSGARDGFGTKKSITGMIVRASATRTTVDVTTGTQDGEYFGDSGGPVFIKMPDNTYRLIGNDWTSPDWNNSGKPRVSTYTSVPFHVAWAEQQSGIDITPCHDAKGWNPGPDCKGSPINPGEGVGTWASSCGGQTMMVIPTCVGDGGVPMVDAGAPPADTGAADRGASAVDASDANAPNMITDAAKDTGVTPPGPPPVTTPDASTGGGSGGMNQPPGISSGHGETGCSCRAAEDRRSSLAGALALLGLTLCRRRRPRRR